MGCRSSVPRVTPAAHQRPKALDPGSGAPLFHGVRVVELATVVAASSCGRLLAELGAEVIKVEEPNGDSYRKMFREWEEGRGETFGSLFEAANLGKSSVVMDLKTAAGVAELKKLMRGADVFITNLRPKAVETLKLDYQSVAAEFPGLIYAHLTAWGRSGPDMDLPGYDIGSFWAATGMAASFTAEGLYSQYPIGFGDSTTGTTLLAGVAAGLAARVVTGRGSLVDACLLRTGAYCMSAQIAAARRDGAAGYGSRPDYGGVSDPAPQWAVYRCKAPSLSKGELKAGVDARAGHVAVMGADATPAAVAAALGGDVRGDGKLTVRERFAAVTADEAAERLTAAGVQHQRHVAWPRRFVEDPDVKRAGCLMKVAGVADVAHFAAAPFSCGCSDRHGAGIPGGLRRAPGLGAHTADVAAKGWGPRTPAAAASLAPPPVTEPADPPAPPAPAAPLAFVDVVELSDTESSVPSCCAMLADYGATVHRVETGAGAGCLWPVLAEQLRRGKRAAQSDAQLGGVAALLQSLCAAGARDRAVVFAVSWPLAELRAAGLHPEQLRASLPGLVIVPVTPRGMDGGDDRRGDIGAWLHATGFHFMLHGENSFPPQLGALICGMHVLSAACCGIFHFMRTGEGQVADVNYLRSGLYTAHQSFALMTKTPEFDRMLTMSPDDARRYFPVVTALCHRTKDGHWIQLLGVDMPRHLDRVLQTLDLKGTKCTVCLCMVCCCCKCHCAEPTMIEKVQWMFELWNTRIAERIGGMTYAQARKLFHADDTSHADYVWHCDVNMPAQAADYPQLKGSGCFGATESGLLTVVAPMRLELGAAAPELAWRQDAGGSGA